GAEVAIALRVAGDGAVEDHAVPLSLTLIAHKEERLVAPVVNLGNPDRSAECTAELIALQNLARGGTTVARGQFIVAQEFEQISVIRIAAGFRRRVEGSAGACELGGV